MMSASWDSDDLERLIALENVFNTLALISASNFAFLADTSVTNAVKQFRSATEGATLDRRDVRDGVKKHMSRLFDQVEEMAKLADSQSQAGKFRD